MLKLDYCTHKAAKYAVENWHYSRCMPVGKLIKIGVWENNQFIGVVVFSRGATPNLGKPYSLKQTQCVELARVALNKHIAPVSKILAVSIKLIKIDFSRLKLIVSFADSSEGHHGGIYQAGNWIYTGQGQSANFYMIKGKKTHPRSLGMKGLTQNLCGAQKIDKNAKVIKVNGKYRYLMPLDKEIKKQIESLKKPYPKRLKQAMAVQQHSGGVAPT